MGSAAACLMLLASLAAATADAQTQGDWSAPDHGLRARLCIEPSHEPELDKTYDVILELQEVGIDTSLGTQHQQMVVRYSPLSLALTVSDANGAVQSVGPGTEMDQFISAGGDLILPPKAFLSFPIGDGGGSLLKTDRGPGICTGVH